MAHTGEYQLMGDVQMSDLDKPLLNTSEERSKRRVPLSGNPHKLLAITGAAAIICFVLSGIGLGLIGYSFSKLCEAACPRAKGYEGCLDWRNMIGILLVSLCSIAFFYAMGGFMIELSHSSFSPSVKKMTYFSISGILFLIVIIAFQFMIRPSKEFIRHENDTLLVLIGGCWVMSLLPFSLFAMYLGLGLKKPKMLTENPTSKVLTASTWNANRFGIILTLVFLPLWALADTSFSNIWNFSFRDYAPFESPYNLLPLSVARVNEHFNFKLYKDVVIFFTFVTVMVLLGVASHLHRGFNRFMAMRLNVNVPYMFPHGLSLGEAVMCFNIVTLYGIWLWYWGFNYNRIRDAVNKSEAQPGVCCGGSCTAYEFDPHPKFEIAARILGHLSNLSMALVIFPACRNSIMVSCFGIPFERAMKYHRAFGVLSWVFVTAHMAVWDVKWLMEGNLLHNVVTLSDLKISPIQFHEDNFTVFLAEFAWFLMTIALGIALTVRRSRYELFYYTHQISIFFMVVAVVHAWSFWYYAAGSLILWFSDRMIRIHNAAQEIEVLDVSVMGKVVRIELAGSSFTHYVGQYCWLNFPHLSPNWHPITIASAPSADSRVFFIQVAGENTFTEKLWKAAVDNDEAAAVVRVDGPYGRPQYFDRCETVLLVAGGIGITPMLCILHELSLRKMQNVGKVKRVSLWWCVRSKDLLHLGSIMSILNEAQSLLEIEVHVHLTRKDESGEETYGVSTVEVQQGRPDLKTSCAQFPSGANTMLMVCGPEKLVKLASDISFANEFSFHSEEFYF